MDTFCTRCKVLLEESDFDPRIGECPRCGRQYTDKEYKALLKSAQGYDNKSLDVSQETWGPRECTVGHKEVK